MSLEARSSSALFKRAEQLKRWADSDTNREPISPKQKSRKIKFSSGCVFLAACSAGDKEEVLKLLDKGADINTANVDGLTALHQACIDDNADMVEFLVEHGADVNRGDNEGWTPLHATASCGFLYIAKYLIEKGANVAAVNNDGELAVDIAECQKMEDLLREEIDNMGIDCDAARSEEERIMLKDAKEWLQTKSSLVNVTHPKNGATPLHVASAKGYIEVMKLLLECGADIDAQDDDGWTPLHAAAHWGQKEACQLLAEKLADMEAKNYVGQTPFELSDSDMVSYLGDLRKKQNKEEVLIRRQTAKKRTEVQDRQLEAETPSKLKKVELEITESENIKHNENIEKKNRANSISNDLSSNKDETSKLPPIVPKITDVISDENTPWRKPAILVKTDHPSPTKNVDTRNLFDSKKENEVTLRRTNSYASDEFSTRYKALHDRIKYNNTILIPYSDRPKSDSVLTYSRQEKQCEPSNTSESSSSPTAVSPVSSPQPNHQPLRSGLKLAINNSQTTTTSNTSTTTPSTPTTPGGTRLQMFKNFFKSFVPPVRDEESETQRKAHAKHVRQTRRSTQGVTLDDIRSAEQLVKKQNQPANNNNESSQTLGANGDPSNGVSVSATITTGTTTVITRENEEASTIRHERRPSWRLTVDNGSSKFKLEDATKPAEPPSTPTFIRRTSTTNAVQQRPSSAPVDAADTTITLSIRRPKSLEENKENDKENDVRNAQQSTLATQAAIQRRRRPKRRSTGVVNFDNVDDFEQEKDSCGSGEYEETSKVNHQESGTEKSGNKSRLGSTSDIRNENGEIDYKKLYEQQLIENDRLKDKLRKSDEELRETKQTLERLNLVTSKNSLSELEKRERRAMERKLSEMEEELKHLENLKTENQRLKDENGALIRVISKLSK